MTKYTLLFMIIFFLFCGTAQADFYKWKDENGVIHITDYPPPTKSGDTQKVYPDDVSDQDNNEANSKDEQNKDSRVVLYTKDACAACDQARDFLTSKQIPFTEYNIDMSEEAAAKRKAIDDSEDVPFAIINGSQVFGFSESIYGRLLKINP